MASKPYAARKKRPVADLDEILGITVPEPEKPKMGRPLKGRKLTEEAKSKLSNLDLLKGIGQPTLALIFGMSLPTVRSRLANVPMVPGAAVGRPRYDIAVAAQYLVEPKIDFTSYLKTIDPNQLPEKLREGYWNALRKQVAYYREAGESWPTEAVEATLSEFFLHIKDTTTLWIDAIEQESELTSKQRDVIKKQVNNLLKELHNRVQNFAEQARGESILTWFQEGGNK